MTETIYEAVGGTEGLLRLAQAWHVRCLADEVVAHAFSHGYHPEHVERLAAYWAEALGAPESSYTGALGDESHVSRLHAGCGEHVEMDERAIACFAAALDDASIPDNDELRAALKAYFRWSTERLAAYPESADDVPIGLPLVRRSWAGPLPS